VKRRPGIRRSSSSRPPATSTRTEAARQVLVMLHHGTHTALSPVTLSPAQGAMKGARSAMSALVQPGADPLDRFLHFSGGTCIGEAHEVAGVDSIGNQRPRWRD